MWACMIGWELLVGIYYYLLYYALLIVFCGLGAQMYCNYEAVLGLWGKVSRLNEAMHT